MMRATRYSIALGAALGLSMAVCGQMAAAPTGGSPTPSAGASSRQVDDDYKNGVASLEAGDYKDAEQSFRKVVNARSDDGDARAYLGIAQAKLGKYQDARTSLERAIRDETVLPGAWENLGIVYLHFDEVDKANEQLTALGELKDDCGASCPNPQELQSSYDTLRTAIGAYGDGGDPQALLSPTDADGTYQQAVRYVNGGGYRAAVDVLRVMHDSDPTNADVLNYLGFSYRKLGDYDSALRAYQNALALDLDHAGANEYLGELYVELDQIEKAEKQLAKLDRICTFACMQYEYLKALIDDYKSNIEG